MKVVVLSVLIAVLVACSSNPASNSAVSAGKSVKGQASFYADKYQGKMTASGELFKQEAKTAAHRKLPFGTRVKVTNIKNGKSVVVRINDRGPFVKGRIIDLSRSAFRSIGNPADGVIDVEISVLE